MPVVLSRKPLLLMILVLAGLLRLAFITQEGFWFDELYTVKQSEMSYSRMLVDLIHSDVHPPLYHSIVWVVARIFPVNELTIRLPSVLFGFLGVLVVYLFAARIFDCRTGIVAAILLAVNPFGVIYSQEARSYSLLFFLSCLTGWCWWCMLLEPARRYKIYYASSGALLAYTHFYGLLFLTYLALFQLLLAWLFRSESWYRPLSLRDWLVPHLFIALAYLPWLPSFWLQAQRVRQDFWVPVPPIHFSLDFLGDYLGAIELGILALFPIGAALRRELCRRGHAGEITRVGTWFLVGWVLYLLGLPFLISLIGEPILMSKYAISVIAPVVILLARGLLLLPRPARAPAVAAWCIVSVALIVSGLYLRINHEQWREMGEYVSSRYNSRSDLLAYYDPSNNQRFCYLYYLARRLPVSGIRGKGATYAHTLGEFKRRAAEHRSAERLWLVQMRRADQLPEELVDGWQVKGQKEFVGGRVYLLVPNKSVGSERRFEPNRQPGSKRGRTNPRVQ